MTPQDANDIYMWLALLVGALPVLLIYSALPWADWWYRLNTPTITEPDGFKHDGPTYTSRIYATVRKWGGITPDA
jgi:hypothetical protein